VIHSHDITCVLASALFPHSSEYRISRQEMIKGIAGHGYLDELVLPIIENTPRENDLADSLGEAIRRYPKASAVLVRDHGIYVWGDTWEAAKRHSECLHYLFNVSIQMHKVGILQVRPPPAPLCGCCSVGSSSTSTSTAAASVPVPVPVSAGGEQSRKRKAGGMMSAFSADQSAGGAGAEAAAGCSTGGVKFVVLDIEGSQWSVVQVAAAGQRSECHSLL
jgi:hypothetical protein